MDRNDIVSKSVTPRANTVDELTSVLRSQSVEEKFFALPIAEQMGYIDWIERANDELHRRRRMRMIVAVLARSSSEVKLDDG